jgi:hypothetical protein
METPSSGFENQGEYIDTLEYVKWREDLARSLAAFVKAYAAGDRESWLKGCGYLDSEYLLDGPDEEIFDSLLELSLRPKCLGVYRCPQCSRVYIQEEHGENQWGRYKLEGHVGDRWSENP